MSLFESPAPQFSTTADRTIELARRPENAAEKTDSNCEQWVDRFGDVLFHYALLRTGDRHVAEDLVQETFVAAISGKRRFRNEATLSTWLIAILKRKVIDHYRAQPNHRNLAGDVGFSSRASIETRHRAWRDDPAKLCEDQEFWKLFQRCVDKLPNKLTEVFILCEVNQQTPAETRELLGISASNLSMRLHRCRMAIRECLNKVWFQADEN